MAETESQLLNFRPIGTLGFRWRDHDLAARQTRKLVPATTGIDRTTPLFVSATRIGRTLRSRIKCTGVGVSIDSERGE